MTDLPTNIYNAVYFARKIMFEEKRTPADAVHTACTWYNAPKADVWNELKKRNLIPKQKRRKR